MPWNQYQTNAIPTISTEVVDITGDGGATINAYVSRPTGDGPHPGIVLIHHMPGWDEIYLETARRFAQHGYITISPNLYARAGHGTPDEVTARIRAEGGVPDSQVVGDCTGALDYLKAQPGYNGKAGVIGSCSGGRHAYLVACQTGAYDAVVDLWGGGVVQPELTEKRPVAPITMTKNLNCPLLGIFGNDDQSPTPEQVDQHEAELKAQGKHYEFYRYDGAGHGFWYYDRAAYRPVQAMDSWNKVLDFFEKNLK